MTTSRIRRGDTPVGTSATPTLAGIPRLVAEDASYSYTVTAVSVSGAETRRSPAVQVLPEFTAEEKAYFEWKYRYFGDTPDPSQPTTPTATDSRITRSSSSAPIPASPRRLISMTPGSAEFPERS